MATTNGPARAGKPTRGRKAPSTPPDTVSAPAMPESGASAEEPFPIVGIGASAGGLEAFESLLKAMPADAGMALVLVQHLDPSHPSALTEILQRCTRMPVVEAQDQMRVQPDHVYVIPPNRDMLIFHGILQLGVPAEPRGQRLPVDAFLRSLAQDRGERSVGVVLSGTGTDGTLGLRAVFGAGGLCLVQDPATARYDGMPGSAIRAGHVTAVLPVEQMPQAILRGLRALPIRQAMAAAPAAGPVARSASAGLSRILLLLRSASGHDFSQYKKSTIGRRIERRMAQQGIDDVDVYVRFLRENPVELQTLFRELLINVTSFFRDPQAFAALKADVLPALLEARPTDQALRVWVAGCATGEEAYSLAMLLREVLDQIGRDLKVQFYATDLDDDAITTARAGVYPLNIAQDVSPERLRRFFTKEETGYRVKAEIREMVVFAVQSVIKDPPFTRLDLLSCRNLMIYLEPELQNRLMQAFHYALRPGGVLFLSPSESIGSHAELFEPVDRKWKIYRRRDAAGSSRLLPGTAMPWAHAMAAPLQAAGSGAKSAETQLAGLARRALLQAFAPAAVVTDMQGKLLYVHGETGQYLRPAPGHPSLDVVDMAREGLAAELRDALRRAATQGLPTLNRTLELAADGAARLVNLSVRLLPEQEPGRGLLLISFEDRARPETLKPQRRPSGKTKGESQRITDLERELAHAKDHLSAMLEEQQASNEELKSTNEELQSTNEELQSTNEELETSKEELQSVNEELVTVNAELQTKVELMAVMQDDMNNLLDNIHLGTIFLDRHLSLRRFTQEATRVYRLQASDIGRPLADIRCELKGDDLLADAQSVLDTLVSVEHEVCTDDGTWFLARIQPYRTADNVIDGVVLTFADVTERVNALAMRNARDLAQSIVDTVPIPLVVLDGRLTVLSANKPFGDAFGTTLDAVVGQPFFQSGNAMWDSPQLRQLLQEVLPRERGFEQRRVLHAAPGGVAQPLRLSARRIASQAGDVDQLVLLSIECQPGSPS